MSQQSPSHAARLRASGDSRRQRRWALGAGGAAHAVHDGYTDSLYVLLPIWADAFGLSYLQVGALKALFSGAMALFQIPAGLLAERWGERRLLATGMVLLGAGYAAFGAAGGLAGLAVCLALAGLGSAAQHPLASSIIARAFSGGPSRAALGTYNFTGDLGKVAAPASLAFVIVLLGWQTATLAFGIMAAIAGLGVYLALRRVDLGSRPAPRASEHPDADKGWGLRRPEAFACLAGIGVIDSGTRTSFLMLLPFLLAGRGAPVETVGIALALTFAGGAAGKLVCGLAAERIGIIRSVVLTELFTGATIIALVGLPLSAILILLPLLGVALNGTSSVLYGTVGDFAHPDRRSRVFGLFYTLGIGAAAAAPPLYGLLSDAAGLERAMVTIGAVVFLTLPLCILLRPSLQTAGHGQPG